MEGQATENELRQRRPAAANSTFTPSEEGRKRDEQLDKHEHYEFGGPAGVVTMMVGFPILMYYLWICLVFYDGKLVSPTSLDDVQPFLARMWEHVRVDASPNAYAWKVYSGFFFFQLFIAFILPGYQQEGLPVPSLGYKTLMYNCNALSCLYVTMATAAALHLTDTFRLTSIIDNYGHLMTVAIIYGFAVSFGMYFLTVAQGKQIRMSGNFFYDVFMGAVLNPRIGSVDLKMWAEVRIPWNIVFFLAVSGACKQYEKYGYVTPNMAFMCLATWLYVNACGKGEECIPQTWDMFHEKWGFMVIFWNFAGVPFTYVYSVVYMASHDPSEYKFSTPAYVALYVTLLTAYYIFDTSMSQKSRFKMQTQGTFKWRKAFPQLPWGTCENPTYIQTSHGNRLLTSGWWAYARKPNYTADWVQSLTWGLCIGSASIIPYFYSVFFITALIHRCGRDFERCAMKYGKDWDRYCEVVKYKFIPYIY
ncbi:ERG4/ERG24 ergosterol biosynthesis protein [Fomitiporia mediterranea MF3/22]|uniref:ERG4/ERG24 ergosterol biosynthesis protein n=1 Tax=Fomitiporia mediterranea (strain MF3/22) TaxID=694068 RepID=UPI0004408F2D|nr:ERG4/ERG24 ergosterol biosynthesis protein [Fomitiporia mediterranea MF3/22]EJD07687.1 ERG4/ERG24 ergosterol biosynthesis protein [Fomitiporia mediterranea MF3/22]